MNVSKTVRHCGLGLVLGLAVAGSARGQDIGYRSGNTACAGCRLQIGGLISEGTILDARWDGKYPLTAVSHDVHTLRIVKRIDAASPRLQNAFSKGEAFPEVTLTFGEVGRQAEGSRQYNPYITVDYIDQVRMENVYITSYQTSGSQGEGSIPTETLSLNFDKIEFQSQEAPEFVPEVADEVVVGFEGGAGTGKEALLQLSGRPAEKVVVRGWDPKQVDNANPKSLVIEVMPGELQDALTQAYQTGSLLDLGLKAQDGKLLHWEMKSVRVTSYSLSGATDAGPRPAVFQIISAGRNHLRGFKSRSGHILLEDSSAQP